MQHLLGTCCSNVQDHAAKQIDWFHYFHFFTSSTPSETMRSSGSKAGCGKSNLSSQASLETPSNLFPAQASAFSLVSAPWKAELGGWRPDGAAGATRGNLRKRDSKSRHRTLPQSMFLDMSTSCLNLEYVRNVTRNATKHDFGHVQHTRQRFQLGTCPK